MLFDPAPLELLSLAEVAGALAQVKGRTFRESTAARWTVDVSELRYILEDPSMLPGAVGHYCAMYRARAMLISLDLSRSNLDFTSRVWTLRLLPKAGEYLGRQFRRS